MSRPIEAMTDDVVYHVSKLVLSEKWSMTDIEGWLHQNGYPTANREWGRKILTEACGRGLIAVPPREDFELAGRITRFSGTHCRISWLPDDDDAAFEALAELAADQVLQLIRQVQAVGQEIDPPRNEVHIGLAAGGTSTAFANHLGRMLGGEEKLPELWLHTLTTDFFVDNPDSAPIVSLGRFKDVEPKPRYVVLHSVPIVPREELPALRKRPYLRDAFKAAGKIDIVVTSVSVANHDHSMFRHAIVQEDPGRGTQRIEKLRRQGWAGDIMWQPYSKEGRLIDSDVRAVSVVEFADLVRFSNMSARYVVCIAGLCAGCRQPKTKAIVPLMRCTKPRRPFNNLVTTQSTALAICNELGW